MGAPTENQDFIAYRDHGSVAALARVFDTVAPQLLLLAMHVTPDAAQAEDLVQSTFLRAMQDAKRYDGARPVAGWLSGILKNLALDLLRRNRVRQSVGLPQDLEAGIDPATIVGDQDLWDRIAHEIQALAPPYREVLALRIVNGLEPCAIAHSLGRSPSTVRMQLKRGLEKLRKALPVHSACLGSWVLEPSRGLEVIKLDLLSQAAANTAVSTAGPHLSPSFVSQFFGSLLAMKALLAIAVVALALFTYWQLGSEETLASNPTVHSQTAELSQAPTQRKAPSTQVLEPIQEPTIDERTSLVATAEPEPNAPGPSFEVRVFYEADGSPAADIGVYVRPVDGGQLGIESRTDESGVVVFADLDPVSYMLNLDRLEQPWRFSAADQTSLEIRIPQGASVEGHITDLEDKPVAGAQIYRFNEAHHDAMQLVAISNKDGLFRLEHVEEGTQYVARAAGWQPSEVERVWSTRPGLRLQMGARGNQLKGIIVDQQGQPVPFARVAIGTDEDSRDSLEGTQQVPGDAKRRKVMDLEGILLRADSSGRFESHEVPSGFVLIVARKSGPQAKLVAAHHYWQVAGKQEQVQIVLERGGEVHGVVTDSTGKPIPGLKVEAEWEGVPELGQFEDDLGPIVSDGFAYTDASGAYQIPGLLAGDYDLKLNGSRRKLLKHETYLTQGQSFRWSPVIDEIATLEIHLTDHQGLPLSGWIVEVADSPASHIDASFWSRSTDDQGKITVYDLEPEMTYRVRLYAPLGPKNFSSIPTAERENIQGNQGTLSITLSGSEIPD